MGAKKFRNDLKEACGGTIPPALSASLPVYAGLSPYDKSRILDSCAESKEEHSELKHSQLKLSTFGAFMARPVPLSDKYVSGRASDIDDSMALCFRGTFERFPSLKHVILQVVDRNLLGCGIDSMQDFLQTGLLQQYCSRLFDGDVSSELPNSFSEIDDYHGMRFIPDIELFVGKLTIKTSTTKDASATQKIATKLMSWVTDANAFNDVQKWIVDNIKMDWNKNVERSFAEFKRSDGGLELEELQRVCFYRLLQQARRAHHFPGGFAVHLQQKHPENFERLNIWRKSVVEKLNANSSMDDHARSPILDQDNVPMPLSDEHVNSLTALRDLQTNIADSPLSTELKKN